MNTGREILVGYFNHHIDRLAWGRKLTLEPRELKFVLQKRVEIRRGLVAADMAVLEAINFIPWMHEAWVTDPGAPVEVPR